MPYPTSWTKYCKYCKGQKHAWSDNYSRCWSCENDGAFKSSSNGLVEIGCQKFVIIPWTPSSELVSKTKEAWKNGEEKIEIECKTLQGNAYMGIRQMKYESVYFSRTTGDFRYSEIIKK